jgi:hypothetical protein
MNCPKCGEDNGIEVKFCGGCGTKLESAVVINSQTIESDALKSLFSGAGWIVDDEEEDGTFRVCKGRETYHYVVRLQKLHKRITFTMYWLMSEEKSPFELQEYINRINVQSTGSISTLLSHNHEINQLAVTIPVVMTNRTTFADVERFLVWAETNWDTTTNVLSFKDWLKNNG